MAQALVLSANGLAGAAATQAATQSLTTPMGGGPLSLYVVFDVTALTGTSLTLKLEGFDPISGKTWTFAAAFAALVAPGTAVYALGLGIGAAAGGVTAVANMPVPPAVKITVTGVAITTASYTVAAHWN